MARLRDTSPADGRFSPDDFTLSEDGRRLTCPNGHTTATAYRSGSGEGRSFRFFGCGDCPLAERCRDPKSDPDRMRQVFISDYRDHLIAARAYAQTEDFQLDMKRRPLVERVTPSTCSAGASVACLTRYNDARRARRRGQGWADFQAKLSAMAFNLKQWMKLLRHGQVVRG